MEGGALAYYQKKEKIYEKMCFSGGRKVLVTPKLWRSSVTVTHCNRTLCVPIQNAQEGKKKFDK